MSGLLDYVRARTIEDGDCLLWTGTLYNGHPGGTLDRKKILIRRALYERANGAIPAGKIIRCTCNTRLCVHLDHNKLTTYRDVATECGALGLMSGPVRRARIAAAKRAGPQSKLTQDDARAIRVSDAPLSVLSARYRISESTVSRIKRSETRREFVGNVWAGLFAGDST